MKKKKTVKKKVSKKKTAKRKVGKPRQGQEIKKVSSVRMEESTKALIRKRYGSLQGWIDKAAQIEVEKSTRGEQ